MGLRVECTSALVACVQARLLEQFDFIETEAVFMKAASFFTQF